MIMKKIIAILALTASMYAWGVLSTSYEPVSYNCNGSVTQFSFPYTFFDTSDLVVYRVDTDGTSTVLVEGSGAGKYQVTASNNDYSNGATVTTGTTYADGRIVIERSIPYGQELSINGDFIPGPPLEQQLDKLAAQTQQVKDEIGRTLTIPVTDDSSITTEFPNAETRANKAAYFDASGNATVVSLVDSGTTAADEVTITQSAGGVLSVKDDGISTAKIADYAVGNSQIATSAVHSVNILDGDVTSADLDDDSVTTAKISDEAVTFAKLNSGIISTNVALTSNTNLVTEGGIKAYVDAASSFTTNGYYRFGSGLMLQWGETEMTANQKKTVSFPTNFPAACWQIATSLGTENIDSSDAAEFHIATFTYTTTNFVIETGGDATHIARWIAVGY